RAWRRRAPVESLMPLRLAKYGVPLAETGPAGLAAADIKPALLPTQSLRGVAQEKLMKDSGETPVVASAEAGVPGGRPDNSRAAQTPQIAPGELAGPEGQPLAVEGQGANVVLPDVDNRDVVRGYLAQHGRLPDAEELSSFRAERGLAEPATSESVQQPGLNDAHSHTPYVEEGQGGQEPSAPWSGGEHGRSLPEMAVGPASAAFASVGEPGPGDVLFGGNGSWSGSGTAAERTGGRARVTAQVRIPAPGSSPEQMDDAFEKLKAIAQASSGDEREEKSLSLTGPALVEQHYRALPLEQQQQSANALAPVLAATTGYKAGTVRKYIGQIKRSDAASNAEQG
ncbi:hypothetical protein ABZ798_33030, partial [Streptomyces sp. NPDC047803]